jgi:hypothetical protein
MAKSAVNDSDSFPFHSSSAQFIRQEADRARSRKQEKKGKAK